MEDKKYGYPRWLEERQQPRPDCKVEVTFYVHDVVDTITDSEDIGMNKALTRLIQDELGGYGLSMEFTPIASLEELDEMMERLIDQEVGSKAPA